MKRFYPVFGGLLLLAWAWAEATGWEFASNAQRNVIPASARNAGGYRSFHVWSGGK